MTRRGPGPGFEPPEPRGNRLGLCAASHADAEQALGKHGTGRSAERRVREREFFEAALGGPAVASFQAGAGTPQGISKRRMRGEFGCPATAKVTDAIPADSLGGGVAAAVDLDFNAFGRDSDDFAIERRAGAAEFDLGESGGGEKEKA